MFFFKQKLHQPQGLVKDFLSSYYVATLYYKIHNGEIKTKNKLATSEFRTNLFYFSQMLNLAC